MRYIFCGSLVAVGVPLLWAMSYLAYVWWGPTACDFRSETILRNKNPPYTIQEDDRSCKSWDIGGQDLVLEYDKTGERYLIAEWYDQVSDWDIFVRDGDIHVILVDYRPLIRRMDDIPGFKIIYHWISKKAMSERDGLFPQDKSLRSPEARAWALEHSYIR